MTTPFTTLEKSKSEVTEKHTLLFKICTQHQVLDAVFRVVCSIIRLEGHAILAHAGCAVFTEPRITAARDLAILRPPVCVYRIFLSKFPRSLGPSATSLTGLRGSCGWWCLGDAVSSGLVRHEDEVAVSKAENASDQLSQRNWSGAPISRYHT